MINETLFITWNPEDKWNPISNLKICHFAPFTVLSQTPTMVPPQHN